MDADKQLQLTADTLRIGDWIYHPDLLKLEQGSDSVKLEPRVGQLLLFLARHAARPMSREELLAAVWPRRVVGDEALSSAINKLRKAFGDDRQNPTYLETIPTIGYRLIAPVEAMTTKSEQNIGAETRTDNSFAKMLRRPWATSFTVIGVLLATLLAIVLLRPGEKAEPTESVVGELTGLPLKKPTLLILPFANLSTDSTQDYLADGIVEDVITDLSRIDAVRVLARSTSFTYKGKPTDPQLLARELGISHLIEGSMRKSGENLRITARLVDTVTGQNLWSQRYDRTVAEIFEMQEDVARNIVNALSLSLTGEQLTRVTAPPANSFEVYDLYLKGRQALSQRTAEANMRAQDYYRHAILLDPKFSRAYGGIAVALTRYANKGWSDTPKVERDLALHYAQKAVELDPDSPYAYWALGFTHLYRHENAQAADAVRKALRVAPSYADGLSLLAQIYNYSGQSEQALELINEAMLINPLYSWDYLFNLGWAHYTQGEYEKAVKYQRLALERNQYATYARLVLAASYTALNLPGEAAWQVEEVLSYHTNMSIRFLKEETPIQLASGRTKQYLEHLRIAGIPEE